jgi:hypothetical protein
MEEREFELQYYEDVNIKMNNTVDTPEQQLQWGPPLSIEEFTKGKALLLVNVTHENRDATRASLQQEAYREGKTLLA